MKAAKAATKKKKKEKPTNKPFRRRFPERKSAAIAVLGANVRRLRKLRDLIQKDLADKADVDQAAIASIELERSNPTLLAIEALAGALKVSPKDLLS